jgi:Cu2+-exporting ATPase
VAAAPADDGRWQVANLQEQAGLGLSADVFDRTAQQSLGRVRLGSAVHAGVTDGALNAGAGAGDGAATAALWVVLAQEGTLAGAAQPLELARFGLVEDVRTEAAAVVGALAEAGLTVQMLSGDRPESVQRVAAQAGIAQARGACTPQDKLQALQAMQAQGRHVAMVGDGLNDGPVMAGAHVSFAFGRAVPLARSRADFVVLGDSLALVPQAVLLARKTLGIVRQNLWWAAGYNALCVPLAVVGWMPAWLAGLGMALSSLLVVLNAARLSRGLPAALLAGQGGPSSFAVAGTLPAASSFNAVEPA